MRFQRYHFRLCQLSKSSKKCNWKFWYAVFDFLDDFGAKYWWISLKFGMAVVDMRFYDIYSVFQISKNFGFCIKGFLKNIGFSKFWGKKIKILKFRDSHFVERVILHLPWSFCAVCLKYLFLAIFLTLSRFWSKLAWSDPTKTSISQNISDRFRPNLVIRCHPDTKEV